MSRLEQAGAEAGRMQRRREPELGADAWTEPADRGQRPGQCEQASAPQPAEEGGRPVGALMGRREGVNLASLGGAQLGHVSLFVGL